MKIDDDDCMKPVASKRVERIPRYHNLTVCGVIAPREGVIEKPHVFRHRGMSVRFCLNNFALGRHNPAV
jgi:hypothetical protein